MTYEIFNVEVGIRPMTNEKGERVLFERKGKAIKHLEKKLPPGRWIILPIYNN